MTRVIKNIKIGRMVMLWLVVVGKMNSSRKRSVICIMNMTITKH